MARLMTQHKMYQFLKFIPPPIRKRLWIIITLILFSPRLAIMLILPALAFIAGFVYCKKGEDFPLYQRIAELKLKQEFIQKPIEHPIVQVSSNLIAPPVIDEKLNILFDHIIKNFINTWYLGLNTSKDPLFASSIHSSGKAALVKLGILANGVELSNLCLRIFQQLIIHLREYRQFEVTSLPLQDYIKQNQDHHFGRLYTQEQTIQYLKKLSVKITQKGLFAFHSAVPEFDNSPIIIAFVSEILCSTVLINLVNLISDPDFINRQILLYANQVVETEFIPDFAEIVPLPPVLKTKQEVQPRQFYIKIVEARRIPMKGLTGSVYCQVLCGKETRKSKKVDADSNPLFVEDFTL